MPEGNLPPGPRFALLETLKLVKDPYGYYERLRARYGRLFTLHFLWNPYLSGRIVRRVGGHRGGASCGSRRRALGYSRGSASVFCKAWNLGSVGALRCPNPYGASAPIRL
jgi:LSD1 subclass zinc finger protein